MALVGMPVCFDTATRVRAVALVMNDTLVGYLKKDAATRSETAHSLAAAIFYVCGTTSRSSSDIEKVASGAALADLADEVQMTIEEMQQLSDAVRRYIRASGVDTPAQGRLEGNAWHA